MSYHAQDRDFVMLSAMQELAQKQKSIETGLLDQAAVGLAGYSGVPPSIAKKNAISNMTTLLNSAFDGITVPGIEGLDLLNKFDNYNVGWGGNPIPGISAMGMSSVFTSDSGTMANDPMKGLGGIPVLNISSRQDYTEIAAGGYFHPHQMEAYVSKSLPVFHDVKSNKSFMNVYWREAVNLKGLHHVNMLLERDARDFKHSDFPTISSVQARFKFYGQLRHVVNASTVNVLSSDLQVNSIIYGKAPSLRNTDIFSGGECEVVPGTHTFLLWVRRPLKPDVLLDQMYSRGDLVNAAKRERYLYITLGMDWKWVILPLANNGLNVPFYLYNGFDWAGAITYYGVVQEVYRNGDHSKAAQKTMIERFLNPEPSVDYAQLKAQMSELDIAISA